MPPQKRPRANKFRAATSAPNPRLERVPAVADEAGARYEGAGVGQEEGDLTGNLLGPGESARRSRRRAHRRKGRSLAAHALDQLPEKRRAVPDRRLDAARGDRVDPDPH